ncbi:MAG: DUF362 domain-containing protein [Firmicutes bacterium]|nr:DUF362 domain-containing protein [Bacillota bacterium]
MANRVPVYFASVKMKRMREEESYPAKVLLALDRVNLPAIVGGRRVAVKVHLGEGINFQTVHPGLVRMVVEKIKAAGGNPFVVHSWGALDGYKRGYTPETLGCPVLPTGGSREKYYYRHPVNLPGLDEVFVAGEIEDAEALVCLSHVKGHGSSGMGGALKNIGIGMLSAEARSNVHKLIATVKYWDADKCLPGQPCQACMDACPMDAIHWSGSRKAELHIDVHSCTYCGKCEQSCPHDALHLKPAEMFGIFQKGMAHAAQAVMSTFDPGHALFLNYILHVTPWCDCSPYTMPAFIRDVGVLVSTDPVAIDQASLDLIGQQEILEDMVPEMFEVGAQGHPFQRVLGMVKDPYEQVRQAELLGIGSREYDLIEVSPEPAAVAHHS